MDKAARPATPMVSPKWVGGSNGDRASVAAYMLPHSAKGQGSLCLLCLNCIEAVSLVRHVHSLTAIPPVPLSCAPLAGRGCRRIREGSSCQQHPLLGRALQACWTAVRCALSRTPGTCSSRPWAPPCPSTPQSSRRGRQLAAPHPATGAGSCRTELTAASL
jgi:hypothetical protein